MTKGIGKYFSATEPKEPERPARGLAECIANGCPLPGVFGCGHGQSLCCVHDGEDASKWGAQTARIRNRLPMFEFALDMTNETPNEPAPQHIIDAFVRKGMPAPVHPSGGRSTVRSYGAQIKGALINECRGAKEMPRAEKARIDSWLNVGALV